MFSSAYIHWAWGPNVICCCQLNPLGLEAQSFVTLSLKHDWARSQCSAAQKKCDTCTSKLLLLKGEIIYEYGPKTSAQWFKKFLSWQKLKKNLYKSNFIYFLKQSNFMYGSLSLKKKIIINKIHVWGSSKNIGPFIQKFLYNMFNESNPFYPTHCACLHYFLLIIYYKFLV